MIDRLIEFSLTQRLLVLGLTLLLIGAGVQAWRALPIDAFPDISTTQVKIILKAPGMTPEEVEARIAAPIETEMLGIPRQRILRSISKYSLVIRTNEICRWNVQQGGWQSVGGQRARINQMIGVAG